MKIDLVKQADKLIKSRLYDEAEPLLLVALKRDPKNPEVYYLLGEVYCKQQQFAKSVKVLQKANTILPNHPKILHLLGWAHFMNGEADEGRFFMLKALKSEPENIQLLCDLAVLEMQTWNYHEALEYAQKAMILDPSSEMVQEVNSVVVWMYEIYASILQKN